MFSNQVLLELNKCCVRNNQENMPEEPIIVENTENKKRKETVEMRIFHQVCNTNTLMIPLTSKKIKTIMKKCLKIVILF